MKNLQVDNLSAHSANNANNQDLPANESFLKFFKRSTFELTNLKFALTSFVVNNLRRRYRRSILGFAWSLINPLTTMIVLTSVFSIIFHNDPRIFGVYVFTGLMPWTYVLDSLSLGSLALVENEAFLKKVYIPKLFFPLVVVSTEGVNFLFSLTSLMLLGLFLGMKISLSLLCLPLAFVCLFVFNFGLAVFLSISTVYFRDLTHITRQLLQAIFYLIPICYPMSSVPNRYLILFKINPFYYFINLFRIIIYDAKFPTTNQWLIPCILAFTSLILGFSLLKKTEKDIIFRL